MKTAFGLDPSGYSMGSSGFARADLKSDGIIEVTVYEGHVFAQTLKQSDPLGNVAEAEQKTLKACCRVGNVLVDAPIDLQGLPSPVNAYFTWQLARRPVDYAFDALAPLANRIGAPVARFQNMLSALRGEEPSEDLNKVLETYPAATLKLLGLWSSKYGNQPVRFIQGCWEGGSLARIANSFRMVAEDGETLNGDEFDAALCAVTGLVNDGERLQGDELSGIVFERIEDKVGREHRSRIPEVVPENYVLMQALPKTEIHVARKPVNGLEEMLREVTT